MKKEEMNNIIKKETEAMTSKELDNHIKELKHVKNLNIRDYALKIGIPIVLVTSFVSGAFYANYGTFVNPKDEIAYYNEYYQDASGITQIGYDVEGQKGDEIYIKTPWTLYEDDYYIRSVYKIDKEYDNMEDANNIINKDLLEFKPKLSKETFLKNEFELNPDLGNNKGVIEVKYSKLSHTEEKEIPTSDTIKGSLFTGVVAVGLATISGNIFKSDKNIENINRIKRKIKKLEKK